MADFFGSKITVKPQFYYIELLFGIFCSDRLKSQALRLFCIKKSAITISMNGTKMRFDECEFLWNGFTTIL